MTRIMRSFGTMVLGTESAIDEWPSSHSSPMRALESGAGSAFQSSASESESSSSSDEPAMAI